MIGALTRSWDNLFGGGEAAVTVPPLDGALRPNRKLDEAGRRLSLEGARCVARVGDRLLVSAGCHVVSLEDGDSWAMAAELPREVVALAECGGAGHWAAAMAGGGVIISRGDRSISEIAAPHLRCITAMVCDGTSLYVANGSSEFETSEWQTDLLQRNATGSLWRIDTESGQIVQIASELAWPAGLAISGQTLIYAEAWRHRLVRRPFNGQGETVLCGDLPGYPGHISTDAEGHWLSVFAPRSQLVEFVQREPGYRERMIATVPRDFWIAPKHRSVRDFYEPLQGGGVKQLGTLKPWAPTLSAGLCIRLDTAFQPVFSLHSRADGTTHGITSAATLGGDVFVVSHGDQVVVALAADEWGDAE